MSSELSDLIFRHSKGISNNKYFCPFCNHHRPSLSIIDDRYICDICQHTGTYTDALHILEGKTTPEPVVTEEPLTLATHDYELWNKKLWEFFKISDEVLQFYGIVSNNGIIYYPCAEGRVLSHKVSKNLKLDWLSSKPEIFGSQQLSVTCNFIYVTTNIFTVLTLRQQGYDAVGIINYDSIVDGIVMLPQYVKKYVIYLDEDNDSILRYLLNGEYPTTQEINFLIPSLENDSTIEVNYIQYIEHNVAAESSCLEAFKKISRYRAMIYNAQTDIKQMVSSTLNHLTSKIENRSYPIEETESMLLNIVMHNFTFLNQIKFILKFLHPDTQSIFMALELSASEPSVTLDTIHYELLRHNVSVVKYRYRELIEVTDISTYIDQGLFMSLCSNILYFGSKQNFQQLKMPERCGLVDRGISELESYLMSAALEMGNIREHLSGRKLFDVQECLKLDGDVFYEAELAKHVQISTGIPLFDQYISIASSCITTIIGNSGDGKSLFLMNLIFRIAQQNMGTVIWIDLECSINVLLHRIYGCVSRNGGDLPEAGWWHDYEFLERVKLFAGDELWEQDNSATLENILQKIEIIMTLAKQENITISTIVIDHIHQIRSDKPGDVMAMIEAVAKSLPVVAKKHNVAMIIAAQLTKTTAHIQSWRGLFPSISNMSYGGALKNVTNTGIGVANLVYRFDEANNAGHLRKGFDKGGLEYRNDKLHIVVDKARDGKRGVKGAVLEFKKDKNTCFLDMENVALVSEGL